MQRLGREKQIHCQTAHQNFSFFFSSSFPLSFSFLSLDRLIFLPSVGRLLVVVSLHCATLQGTLSTAFMLVAVTITDRTLLCKVLKAHKFCMFNKSTFCIWCLAAGCVCCQYFQSTIPGQELSVHKTLKSPNCHLQSENSFVSVLLSSA